MPKYIEHEIKVLGVDVVQLQAQLEELGAKKVFDDFRIFTTFDTPDRKYTSNHTILRLTEEGKLKLSISSVDKDGTKETVKVFTSRKEETVDFLAKLGVHPIAQVQSHRISYEWGDTDFDIDQFPEIPAFLEIDTDYLPITLEALLQKLELDAHQIVTMGTEEIFSQYDKSYFELFKI